MAGVYAPDGSYRVTLVDDGAPVTTLDSGPGVYAHDGSYRVTVVAVEGSGAIVVDQQALVIPVTGSYTDTATVTVVDGEVTAITLS